MSTTLFLRPAGERPAFWRVAVFLWWEGVDFDSDGNSRTPDDRHWTELTVRLRPGYGERVDVDPLHENDSVLVITGSSLELVARAAWYLATESGGTVSATATGPFMAPSSIEPHLGDFDTDAALRRARG